MLEKTDRSFTCWNCKHAGDFDFNKKPSKCLCKKTKRRGRLERGYSCDKFEYRQWHNNMGDDGIPIKNRQPLDYRTEKQWEDAGRKVIDQSAGVEMHPTRRSRKTCIYYLIENTKLINKEGEEGEGNYCP